MSGRGTKKVIVALVSAIVLVAALASASPAAAEDFLSGYVANEESPSLTKFDTTTNEGVETVGDELGEPASIVMPADGSSFFATESCDALENNGGTLLHVSLEGNILGRIELASESCIKKIAMSSKADVGDSGETVWAVIGDEAVPVDSADGSVGRAIVPPASCPNGCVGEQVIDYVNDVALSPDGNTLYVLYTEKTIRAAPEEILETYIDKLVTYEVGGASAVQVTEPTFVAISEGKSIAVSGNGRKAFISSSLCAIHQLCTSDLTTFELGPDPNPNTQQSQNVDLTEGGQVLQMPDENYLWVAQDPETLIKGEAAEVFETDTGPPYSSFFREFDLNDPIALAAVPDEGSIYVGFHDRSSIAALTVDGETEIPVGEGPVGGIVLTPAQAPDAKLTVHPAGLNQSTKFDASESTITCDAQQCSEIAEYKWNFGDGSEETTTVPTTEHTYRSAGPFEASVTEVSSYGVSTELITSGHQVTVDGGPQARAAVTVTLPALVTRASGPTRLGGSITDTLILTEGQGQSGGAVEFRVYGPDDTTCQAPALESTTVPVNGDGEFTSPAYTPTELGTYHWTTNYVDGSGDPPALGNCGDAEESTEVIKALPTVPGVASPGVVIGGQVSDKAEVTGGAHPTGTIDFALYAPGDVNCTGTPVFTDSSGLGEDDPLEPDVATSATFAPTRAGRYRWIASYSGDADNEAVPGTCNSANQAVSIGKATPTIATHASPDVRVPEGLVFDVATVSGGYEESGTVGFALYGPLDPTCEGGPVFTATAELGADGTATSPDFAPGKIGEYHWVATYGGDVDNNRVAGTCGDANESVTAGKATPGFETRAVERVTIGGEVSDTAILSGGHAPTGTISFALYGPDDATCSGPPLATDSATVQGNGSFQSTPFTAVVPGTYRWVAEYSGDAENEPAAGTCGAEGETSVVAKATPTLDTTATAEVGLGGPIAATASVGGGHGPTGTVTFDLFAPDDAACTGSPVFTATVPLGADGSASSGAFTPIAAGAYAWRATYSGDDFNDSVTGACGPSSNVIAPTPPPSPPAGSQSSQPPSSPASPSPEADLSVKLSAPKRGLVGKELTYKIAVANDGDLAAGVVELNVRLGGARAEIKRAKGPGCKGDRAVTCKLGSLAPGKKVEVEITLLPKALGRLTLTGTVDGSGADAAPGNDRASDTIRIAARHR
jgi:PKD domain/Domain of unknown function DUF11